MSTRRQDSTPARSAATRTRPRKRHELAEIGIRLLDEAHAAWQRAELECEQALRSVVRRITAHERRPLSVLPCSARSRAGGGTRPAAAVGAGAVRARCAHRRGIARRR